MADRVETGNSSALCEYANKLSLSDVLCGPGEQTPAAPKPAESSTHIHKSPFGPSPERAPQVVEKPLQPGAQLPKAPEQSEKPKQPGTSPELRPFEVPKPNVQPKPNGLPPFSIEPPARPQSGPQQSKGPTVYVDIGHCTSKDAGSGKVDHGFEDSYTECQVNKAVGKNLINELKGAGFRVVPSWNPDAPPTLISKQDDLKRRNNVVNADIAANRGDSIYLSIHHDNDPKKTSGQCVYYAQPKEAESMTLAKTIQASAWKVRDGHRPSCIDPDTLTHNGKLVGLRGVNTIGILIEGANVQNPGDKQLMTRPDFQQREAKSIASGVINYFRLKQGTERPLPPALR